MCVVLVLLLRIIVYYFQGMYECVSVFVLFCIIALHDYDDDDLLSYGTAV